MIESCSNERIADIKANAMISSQHVYEVRPRNDHRGVDLISDALPFGRLWYAGPDATRSHSKDGSKVSTKPRTELKIGHL
jgi:hypothetical protein